MLGISQSTLAGPQVPAELQRSGVLNRTTDSGTAHHVLELVSDHGWQSRYALGIPAYAAGLTSAALTVKGPILLTLDRAIPDTVNMAPGYDLSGDTPSCPIETPI